VCAERPVYLMAIGNRDRKERAGILISPLWAHPLVAELPLTRPHLLKVPLPPKAPQPEDQAFTTWALGSIANPNYSRWLLLVLTSVYFIPPQRPTGCNSQTSVQSVGAMRLSSVHWDPYIPYEWAFILPSLATSALQAMWPRVKLPDRAVLPNLQLSVTWVRCTFTFAKPLKLGGLFVSTALWLIHIPSPIYCFLVCLLFICWV
jgi:hypothetical protein